MPYPEYKSENYTNFGGINTKTSQYITEKNEFLNLQNVDFNTLGALSSTPGSTQFTPTSATSPIVGLADFYPVNQTFLTTGSSYAIIASAGANAYRITGTTFVNIYTYVRAHALTSYGSDYAIGDNLFGADGGYNFWMYQGFTTAWEYSLPKPALAGVNTYSASGTGGISGLLNLYFAFIRQDGFIGPAVLGHSATYSGNTQLIFPTKNLVSGVGVSAGSFGISGLVVWYSLNGSEPTAAATLAPLNSTFLIQSPFTGWSPTVYPFEEYFGTFLYGFASDNGSTLIPSGQISAPIQPSTVEIFANQMFFGGFANAPDDVWYSQIGEYEKKDLEANFEVRANDGDIVSCMVSYFTQLVIFKTNTIHALTGSDPDSFVLTETNSQYGCLSSRGACVWEQQLWFLDKRGICEYNGANTQIVSQAVEDYFNRMNIQAARYNAVMLHVKERNQVWCAIPIDGATSNNLIIIYDYIAKAWTTRTTPVAITALNNISQFNQGLTKPIPFFGSYSGLVYSFGQSLLKDNGSNFTIVMKTRFLSDLGHSVEKVWRRLYLDAAVPAGQTFLFYLNFYANQGTSAVYSTTMALSQFQRRIDFGIPSKDLSVEMIYSGGQFLEFNGYTIEYRFQRAT